MINYSWAESDDSFKNKSLGFKPSKIDYPMGPAQKWCPALKRNKDFWVIKAPYTYHLKHSFDSKNGSTITLGPENSFEDPVFDKNVDIHDIGNRNNPEIPTLQLILHMVFFSDEEDVTMEMFPAWMNHELNKQPLVTCYGSFPISNWIRPINFAFDWVDPSKEIIIKRGSPLLYIRFSKNLPLKEVPMTPELGKKIRTCAGMPKHYHHGDWKWMFKHMRSILWN